MVTLEYSVDLICMWKETGAPGGNPRMELQWGENTNSAHKGPFVNENGTFLLWSDSANYYITVPYHLNEWPLK